MRCFSIDQQAAKSKQQPSDLYLHLFASYIHPQPPRLILSAPIHLSSDFDIPIEDNQHLKGRIEPRNGIPFVHFQGGLCSGMNVFDCEVELEKSYQPWPQPYDDKAPFVCQPHFILSSNSNPKFFLKRQATAEKKQWQRKNPLTSRQLAEVKRKFHLMRPGMTTDEVFVMLGLSAYRNRLLPSNPFLTRFDMADYQLADGERLMLFFDCTGMKTKSYQLADGENLRMVDFFGNGSLVIQAELDTAVWSSNAPPLWRTTSQWP